MPPQDGKPRPSLVVNDEGAAAQFVTIEKGRIEPGDRIALIDEAIVGKTRGELPSANECPDPDEKEKTKFEEFDGEGVAYSGGYYYVVGSHGCGRKKGRFKSSSLHLARIRVNENGEPAKAELETTFRLAEALKKAPIVGGFYLRSLREQSNGLNVEGIAVLGDRLFAGLRAPSLGGYAFLVSVPIDALFAKDEKIKKDMLNVIALKIGEGAGIRDLAPYDRTRLLVLTGPAQEQLDVPYALHLAEPSGTEGEVEHFPSLADLDDTERAGKAEAVTRLDDKRVLVLFDGLASGGPKVYDIKP